MLLEEWDSRRWGSGVFEVSFGYPKGRKKRNEPQSQTAQNDCIVEGRPRSKRDVIQRVESRLQQLPCKEFQPNTVRQRVDKEINQAKYKC